MERCPFQLAKAEARYRRSPREQTREPYHTVPVLACLDRRDQTARSGGELLTSSEKRWLLSASPSKHGESSRETRMAAALAVARAGCETHLDHDRKLPFVRLEA